MADWKWSLNVVDEKPGRCPVIQPTENGECPLKRMESDGCVSDSDCELTDKCCKVAGCFPKCLPAILPALLPALEKPGRCPNIQTPMPNGECPLQREESDSCLSDADCEGIDKCCSIDGCYPKCLPALLPAVLEPVAQPVIVIKGEIGDPGPTGDPVSKNICFV